MLSFISLPPALAVLAATFFLPRLVDASPMHGSIGKKDPGSSRFQPRHPVLGDQQQVLEEPKSFGIPTTTRTIDASRPTKAPWLALVVSRTAATTTISNGTMPTTSTAPNIVWQQGAMKQKENVAALKQPSTSLSRSSTSTGRDRLCSRSTSVNEQQDWQPIWGSWNGTTPHVNDEPVYMAEAQLQLPFPMCIGGQCSRVITVGTDGYFYLDAIRGEIKIEVFSGQGQGSYLYPARRNGVFYSISGEIGSRKLTLAWFAGTFDWEHEQNYFTATYQEDEPGSIVYNYHSILQSSSGPQAQASVQYPSHYIVPWPRGNRFDAGMEMSIATGNGLKPPNVRVHRHEVVPCR